MARTFRWEISEDSHTQKKMTVVNEGEFIACTWREAKIKATKASKFGFGYWQDAFSASYKSPNQKRRPYAPSLKLWVKKGNLD